MRKSAPGRCDESARAGGPRDPFDPAFTRRRAGLAILPLASLLAGWESLPDNSGRIRAADKPIP